MSAPSGALVAASVIVLAAVVCLSLSFATDHWQDVTIQREKLKEKAATSPSLAAKLPGPLYFSRHRGLFRTCYRGNETKFLDRAAGVVDGACMRETGYELPSRDPSTVNYGEYYDMRIHLMRAHFAFLVLGLVLEVSAAVLGAVACWRNDYAMVRATGIVAFVGALLSLGGMAFFHGYEFIENDKLDFAPFPAYWQTAPEYYALQSHYTVQYGYSYMLGWIGVGLACIAAVLFLFAAVSLKSAEGREKAAAPKSRNRAYDYVHQPQLMYAPQEYTNVPAVQAVPAEYGQPMAVQQPYMVAYTRY